MRSRARILLIAPYFAPSASVGAKRFSFLVEKLAGRGYAIDTLTMEIGAGESVDTSIPLCGTVHRILGLLPHTAQGQGLLARIYNRLMITTFGVPDHYVGWLPRFIAAGRQIASLQKPDVIISTGPPFTAFLAGAILARRTDCPLILDYRDPWRAFDWGESTNARRAKRWLERRLERFSVSTASALVFATDYMRERFEAIFEGTRPMEINVVTNGFDDLSDPRPLALTPGAVNILYAGSFYGERNVSVLAEGIRESILRSPTRGRKYMVHVFGKLNADDRNRLEACGLRDLVHEHEPVEHGVVLGYMKAADVLYLPSGTDVRYALPFKAFDYLCVRRPILAISPIDSAVAQFVTTLDCGEVVDGTQPAITANALERLVDNAEDYGFRGRDQFTWTAVADKYDLLIRRVTAS